MQQLYSCLPAVPHKLAHTQLHVYIHAPLILPSATEIPSFKAF